MKEIKLIKKSIWKTIITSKISLLILFVVLLLSISSLWNLYEKYNSTKSHAETIVKDLNKLNIRKNKLIHDIAFLKTERGLEEEIRNKFDVKKAGEEVIFLFDKNEKKVIVEKRTLRTIMGDVVEFFMR